MGVSMTRRSVLAATASSIGLAGCMGRLSNVAGRDQSTQVTLEITTTPADSDPHAIRIARHLAENLERAGIEPRVTTMRPIGLYRQVLLNHDFDLYVGQFPENEAFDPDVLYPLCHSEYNSEPGWQNPFGFTDPTVDELLEEQRHASGPERGFLVDDLQQELARHQPFIVVAFPDALIATRDTDFRGWYRAQPTSPLGLIALENVGDGAVESDAGENDAGEGDDESANGTLRLAATDTRITENRNPIAPEYRRYGKFTGLLYDPLVRRHRGEMIPWLVDEWEWEDDTSVRLTLRDTSWHDDEPLTASDVTFTYAFFADTSLGDAETPIPTSRFRGRSSLVRSASIVDDRTVDVRFQEADRGVQIQALTVPILPEHVWSELTGLVTLPGGIEINNETTEAQVWSNPEPVGSGPLKFREAEVDDYIVLERNDDHPLVTDPMSFPAWLRDKPAFAELEVAVVPSDIAAVQRVGEGIADATASNIGPDAVPRVGREADVRLVSAQSAAFYHIGCNVRNEPLSNPHFRQTLARLVDKATLVDTAFQGYAHPAASPLAVSEEWLAEELRWEDDDPQTPFLGRDGVVDGESARAAFRDIGYRYNEDGELLLRES